MRYAVVLGEHPQIALPVGMNIITEIQLSIVVFHLVAIHIDTGEPLQTATPKGMAHGVFRQSVIGAEIVAIVIKQPHTGMPYVCRIIDALDAVLPRTDP